MITKYNLGNRVILAGKQPYKKIPDFIAAADICILPAHNNKTMRYIVPIKLYEYMAMCKPVVSTKLPGVVREFGKGNGIFYVDTPEAALNEILKLLKNGKLKLHGERARMNVKRNDWSRITDQFERLLMDLV